MLSEEGCGARRRRLWELLAPGVQWVLVADPRHVAYLCGFSINPFSHSASQRSFLLLTREGGTVLACDEQAMASAMARPFVDRTVLAAWYDQRRAPAGRDAALVAALGRFGAGLPPAEGMVETEWFPVGAMDTLGLPGPPAGPGRTPLGGLLRRMRRRKDSDEIALLRLCIEAGEAGIRQARQAALPGSGELEVFLEVQRAAGQRLGFPAPVYGDFRAATPSHPSPVGPPGAHILAEGDTLIVDLSVVVACYRCDLAATIAVGEPTTGQQELLGLCRQAMQAGEEALGPGAPASGVYRAVAGPFAAAGRRELFPHHAGHGIGLSHPEAPAFVRDSDEVLQAGEVVTLEPGAYARGVGGVRIENDYLVTETGAERLSGHGLEL